MDITNRSIHADEYRAHAKINLTLNITAKRPDGYHELESIMQAVSLYDTVRVWLGVGRPPTPSHAASAPAAPAASTPPAASAPHTAHAHHAGPSPGGLHTYGQLLGSQPTGGLSDFIPSHKHIPVSLNCFVSIDSTDNYILSQGIPFGRENTVYRAAEEFFARQDIKFDDSFYVRIHMTKRIPAGAGLGGSSSDAAAVLLALNDIAGGAHGIPGFAILPRKKLLDAALGVGADVPFCLLYGPDRASSRMAFATGVGEKMRRIGGPRPKYTILLVNPRFELSTEQVFKDYALAGIAEINNLTKLAQDMIKSQNGMWDRCFNTVERPMAALHPGIGRIKSALLDAGAVCAVMSGTGPTVFSLFEDGAKARSAADLIGAGGSWTAVCGFAD